MNLATGEAENTFTAMGQYFSSTWHTVLLLSVACGGASSGSGLETWSLEAGSEVTATWTSNWPPAHLGTFSSFVVLQRLIPRSCFGVHGKVSWK
jgi:hypothetical protein